MTFVPAAFCLSSFLSIISQVICCLYKRLNKSILSFNAAVAKLDGLFLLRWLIVPSKRRCGHPSDSDDKKLAQFLTEPSALRARFQSYCAINPLTNLGMMSVENAYQCLQKARPLLSKIKTLRLDAKLNHELPLIKQVEMAFQQGLLTKDEWKVFLDYMIHHEDALQVDSFTYNLHLCKRNPVNLNVSLETQFEEMVERLATGNLNAQLNSAQKLDLYGLYQQATIGDIACVIPPATDFVARAKYQAWEKCKGMRTQEAMQLYINLLAG